MEKLAGLLVGLLIANAVAHATKSGIICTHKLSYWDKQSKETCKFFRWSCSTEDVDVITTTTVQLCCPGYKYYNDYYNSCQATCTKDCHYGYCLESRSKPPCHCKKYTVTIDWECTPVCEPACEHGTCEGPNQCKCNHGYEKTNNSLVCAPQCPMENCDCIPDGNCVCPQKDAKNDEKCVPIACNGTGNCNTTVLAQECGAGYERDGENLQCVPQCSEVCLNGRCEEPEVCSCETGYEKNARNQSCVSQCGNGCGQGNCTGIDECRCWDGFKTDVDGSCTEQCDGDCAIGAVTSGQNVVAVLLVIGTLISLLVVIATGLICYWRKRQSKQHAHQEDGIPLDFSVGSQLPVIEECEEDNCLYGKFDDSGEKILQLPDQISCDTGNNQQVVPEEINYYSTINQQSFPEEVNYYCSINPQAVPEVHEETNYYCSINPQAVPEVSVPGELIYSTTNHEEVPEEVAYYSTIKKSSK